MTHRDLFFRHERTSCSTNDRKISRLGKQRAKFSPFCGTSGPDYARLNAPMCRASTHTHKQTQSAPMTDHDHCVFICVTVCCLPSQIAHICAHTFAMARKRALSFACSLQAHTKSSLELPAQWLFR